MEFVTAIVGCVGETDYIYDDALCCDSTQCVQLILARIWTGVNIVLDAYPAERFGC